MFLNVSGEGFTTFRLSSLLQNDGVIRASDEFNCICLGDLLSSTILLNCACFFGGVPLVLVDVVGVPVGDPDGVPDGDPFGDPDGDAAADEGAVDFGETLGDVLDAFDIIIFLVRVCIYFYFPTTS